MGSAGSLGELEQLILLAAMRLGPAHAYGTRVREELEAQAGRRVSRGALYVTIDRLVEKSLLETRTGDPTPGRGGRPRRYLSVTPQGVEALRASRKVLTSLWKGLDALAIE